MLSTFLELIYIYIALYTHRLFLNLIGQRLLTILVLTVFKICIYITQVHIVYKFDI